MIVTIDGPAGSGKSTIARKIAEQFRWMYLDTGAMYRAVAFKAVQDGIRPDDKSGLAVLASHSKIAMEQTERGLRVFLDGEDVSDKIRSEVVSNTASKIATISQVRKALVEQQRYIAGKVGNIVTEGRDQGSVVFPGAEVKVYLDASVEERANRRYHQLQANGKSAELVQIKSDIRDRDKRDKSRVDSPLIVPEGAEVIDTTGMNLKEVFDRVVELVNSRSKTRQ